jgi:prepilin-type N-terminal cleavage/methylation domain-containing protein
MSGLAIVSFMGVSRSLRLTSGAEAFNQALLNSRQQAITSQSARRVVLNLVNGSFWTERKNVESRPFDPPTGKNAVRTSEVESLPKNVIVADVGGFIAENIQGNEKIWYFEFDNRGTAITYPAGGGVPTLNPRVHHRAFTPNDNMAIHLIMDNAAFLLAENGTPVDYNLNDSAFTSFIGRISGLDRNNNGVDDYAAGVDAKVAAAARRQEATVFFLTLTGRSQVFDYGYGFPWSERMHRTVKHHRARRGFTLVEVIIALVILGIGLVGVIQLFPMGLRSCARAENGTRAAILAQQIMEALKADSHDLPIIPGDPKLYPIPGNGFDDDNRRTCAIAIPPMRWTSTQRQTRHGLGRRIRRRQWRRHPDVASHGWYQGDHNRDGDPFYDPEFPVAGIDEEYADGRDNDGDGKIDEDTMLASNSLPNGTIFATTRWPRRRHSITMATAKKAAPRGGF